MEELRFKATVENVVTLKGGMTIVKLNSDDPEAPEELSLTYLKQKAFQTGEYSITITKIEEPPVSEPEPEVVDV